MTFKWKTSICQLQRGLNSITVEETLHVQCFKKIDSLYLGFIIMYSRKKNNILLHLDNRYLYFWGSYLGNRNLSIYTKHVTGGRSKFEKNNWNFFSIGNKSLPYDFFRKLLNILTKINYSSIVFNLIIS